jgi:hypothetical protein
MAKKRKPLSDLVPTNWCDPILTGPDAVLKGNGGTWGCPDIERVLLAVKERIRRAERSSKT